MTIDFTKEVEKITRQIIEKYAASGISVVIPKMLWYEV